jgi:replicative DNA helicase
MSETTWIRRKINELPQEQQSELVSELLAQVGDTPLTKTEGMELALMSDFSEEAKELHANFGKMQGISTGYNKLDALMKGLVPGELIVVAGKTSRGKTTLALNIANKVALQNKTVLFVTLEMTHAEITSRSMFINDGDTEQYQQVAGHTVFQKTDELDWQSIDKLMEKAKIDMGVELVVIDHLHYFTRELQNVAEDLGRITKEFKKNAIRHKVPVILISHVRKTSEGKEATMEDLRGSSYMGQDADIVLMVGRMPSQPEYTFVRIEKNRNRGFDPEADTVQLYTDKIKIYDRHPSMDIPDFK